MSNLTFTNATLSNSTLASNLTDQAIAQREIACYSLPYGGVGFASHMLTYYTILMLFLGRRPLNPLRMLKHPERGLILSVLQLIITTVLSSIAIHRCQNEWPYAILGVWMLLISITVSILIMSSPYVSQHNEQRARMAQQGLGDEMHERPSSQHPLRERMDMSSHDAQDKEQFYNPDKVATRGNRGRLVNVLIAFVWFLGSAAGATAIFGIITRLRDPSIMNEKGPFQTVNAILGLLCFLPFYVFICQWTNCIAFCIPKNWRLKFVTMIKWQLICVSLFALIWMDWMLGLLTGNLAGTPHDLPGAAQVVYYGWLIAKRLGLLST
jgi:hypothetical protein